MGSVRAIAKTLAEEGYDLVLVDVAELGGTVAEVGKSAAGSRPRVMDVSSETDVVALAADVRERFGQLNALINNAGISLLVPAENTPLGPGSGCSMST